jgi:hypothetical protein
MTTQTRLHRIKNSCSSLWIVSMLFLMLTSTQASATLTLTPADCTAGYPCWTSLDNSAFDADDVEALVGTSTELDLLWKGNVGDANNPATTYAGSFADSYTATFTNSALDPEDAVIAYVMTEPKINCTECYLVVKDGRQNPAQYVYKINWDGMMNIELTDFWPTMGAISHVAIFGGEGEEGTSVPEPSTYLSLSTLLTGIFAAKRRRAKSQSRV